MIATHTVRTAHTYRLFERVRRALALILAMVLIAGAIPAGLFTFPGLASAVLPDADPAIDNYPSQFEDWTPGTGTGETVTLTSDEVEWSTPPSIMRSGYDTRAYTTATSKQFNGYSTPEHVVFDNDNVRFLGYDIPAYMDMIYSEEYQDGFSSMSFTMSPVVMNFHTFSESGILFNGSFDSSNRYTGYMLVLKCGNMEGMKSYGEAELSLVYVQNELMNGNSYSPGTLASTRSDQIKIKTGIGNLTTPTFAIDIVRDPATGGFVVYLDGQEVAEVANPKSDANGFGFFTGYYAHSCQILSVIEYNGIAVTIGGEAEPVPTYATVRFMDINGVTDRATGAGGTEIANAQHIPVSNIATALQDGLTLYKDGESCWGYSYDSFKVTPPLSIGEFRYVTASRSPLDPVRYSKNPLNNEIILYYDTEVSASKSASVNGLAGNGSLDEPVPVSADETIDYSLALTNPGVSRVASPDIDLSSYAFTEVWYGSGFGIARQANGDIYGWGQNPYGQLGNNSTANPMTPVKNEYLSPSGTEFGKPGNINSPVAEFWCVAQRTMARLENGDIYVWGRNETGELGINSTVNQRVPVKNEYLSPSGTQYGLPNNPNSPVAEISCGYAYNIARLENGDVYVWGDNGSGQLGTNNTTNISRPVKNQYLSLTGTQYGGSGNPNSPLKEFWCGNHSTIARLANGDIYVWGRNNAGQLGINTTTNELRPTKNEYLSPSGTQHGLANNPNSRVTEIRCGASFTIARLENGDVYVWGENGSGALGINSASNQQKPIKNEYLSPSGMEYGLSGNPDSPVAKLWSGDSHSVALLENGDVYVWGYNGYGQLGINSTSNQLKPSKNQYLSITGSLYGNSGCPNSPLEEMWPGSSCNIARLRNGDFYVWGSGGAREFGNNSAAQYNVPVANPYLGNRGSFAVFGDYTHLPSPVKKLWNLGYSMIAQLVNGDIYVWGHNGEGQLGIGSLTNQSAPIKNEYLSPTGTKFGKLGNPDSPVKELWCNNSSTSALARLENGDIYVWGRNNVGQLGINSNIGESTPVKNQYLSPSGTQYGLPGNPDSPIKELWCGSMSSAARLANGDIYVWGSNGAGRLGINSTSTQLKPVKNEYLSPSGTQYGLPGNPDSPIADFWNGFSHAIARLANGDIYVWGANSVGGLGINSTISEQKPVKNEYLSPSGTEYGKPGNPDSPIVELEPALEGNTARLANGDIYVWGYNTQGQLGINTIIHEQKPVKNEYLSLTGSQYGLPGNPNSPVTKIWSGAEHTLVRLANGDIYVWGLENNNGVLGMNYTTGVQQRVPVKNEYLSPSGTQFGKSGNPGSPVAELWPGSYNNVARLVNGDIYVWGNNTYGELGINSVTHQKKPVKSNYLWAQPEKFKLTDLLPRGLSVVTSGGLPVYTVTEADGITPADAGSVTVTTEVEGGRERITFSFTKLPSGVVQFNFSVNVGEQGFFENTAQFIDATKGQTLTTNATYHATGHKVIEKYQQWHNAQGDALPKADTYRAFGPAFTDKGYAPYPTTLQSIPDGSGNVWRYYAYSVDGGTPVIGVPPLGLYGDYLIEGVESDHEVIFYFVRDVKLTIEYREIGNETGPDLKAPVNTAAPAMLPYNLPVTHMNQFINASTSPYPAGTWNYANKYSLDGGETWQTGTPPVPAYSATSMTQPTADKHIILCFTQAPIVTVRYREYAGMGQSLRNVNGVTSENFILEGTSPLYSFDAMDQPSVADTKDSGATSTLGVLYKHYRGYSISSEDVAGVPTIHLGVEPPVFDSLLGGEVITLYFSTQYTVTEHFHANDADHDTAATVLKDQVTTDIFGGEIFNGSTPRPNLYAQGYEWQYIGWVMDRPDPDFSGIDAGDFAAMTALCDGYELPSFAVTSDGVQIIYIYAKVEQSTKLTIVERFREKDNTGMVLTADLTSTVEENSSFPGAWPSEITSNTVTYEYWGYQLDNGEPQEGPFPGIDPVSGPHTITYLYQIPGEEIVEDTYGGFITKAVANNTSSDGKYYAGDEISYTISVTNTGTADWNPGLISDTLPEEVSYLFATDNAPFSDNVSYSASTHTVTADGGLIPAGETKVVLTITVTINEDASGKTITNVATASNDGSDDEVFDTEESEEETTTPQVLPYTIIYLPGTTDPVSGLPSDESHFAGEMVTVGSAPTREGYTFLGYLITVAPGSNPLLFTEGTYQPGNTFAMPEAHLIATALWQKKSVIPPLPEPKPSGKPDVKPENKPGPIPIDDIDAGDMTRYSICLLALGVSATLGILVASRKTRKEEGYQ